MTTKEIWKDIKGFEGLYSVSNTGKVKNIKTGKMLSPSSARRGTGAGYLKIGLSKNGVSKSCNIHRLVAEHFLPPSKGNVLFKDNNRNNVDVTNLFYGTLKTALELKKSNGLIPGHNGENSGFSKFNTTTIKKIRNLFEAGKFSKIELADKFSMSFRNVHRIITREIWYHI